MPAIYWRIIEGGRIGRKVAQVTQGLMNKFFDLGIKDIEAECNEVSSNYVRLWSSKSPTDLMNEYHLDMTYRDGCTELAQNFKLFEPAAIWAEILDSYCSWRSDTAATIQHSAHDPMNPLLTIYLKALAIKGSTITWTGFSTSLS